MLGGSLRAVFSKRAVLGTCVGAHETARDEGAAGGWGELGPVGGGRDAEGASEAGGERADALQADREADVGDRAIGVAQQRRRPLEAARQQVGVRRLAKGALELAAEVRP